MLAHVSQLNLVRQKTSWLPHWGWLLIFPFSLIPAIFYFSIWMPYNQVEIARQEIDRLGGSYVVEPGGGREWFRHIPEWVWSLLGEHATTVLNQQVVAVSFTNLPIENDDLRLIAIMKDLKMLRLTGTKIDDRGLIYLRNLDELQRLRLGKTKISDEGLKHLKNLKQLEKLELSSTGISADGLLHLKELPNLWILDCQNTGITRQDVESLRVELKHHAIHL